MVQAIVDITVNQGIDPRDAVLVGGGGAAGLNSVLIARRLETPRLVIPEVGAALSAAGALMSDLTAQFHATLFTRSDGFRLCARQRRARRARSRRRAPSRRSGARIAGTDGHLLGGGALSRAGLGDRGDAAERALCRSGRRRSVDRCVPCDARGGLRHSRREFGDRDRWLERLRRLPHSRRTGRHVGGIGGERGRGGDAHGAISQATAACPRRCGASRRSRWARQIAGPAIIESSFTTVVVNPGAAAERRPSGSLSIDPGRERHGMSGTAPRRSGDGVRLALLNNRLRERRAQDGEHAVAHRPLRRAQHRARLLLLHRHRATTELLATAESLPIHVLSGPDLMARSMQAVPPEAAARRRLPAQLALSRLLARGRPHDPGAGDRRRRRAPLHRARQGPSGRLRQLRSRPPTWATRATSTRRAR